MFLGVFNTVGEGYNIYMTCKKCTKILTGKQTVFCSEKCSKQYLKNAWQKRRKDVVNRARRKRRALLNYALDKKWQQANPEKYKAHKKVQGAVRRGSLVKQPCEKCGDVNVQGHHDDYSKPLVVRWLCVEHHNAWHKKNNAILTA